MSIKLFELPVWKSVGLFAGVGLLLAHGSAMAMPRTGVIVSQARSSDRSVVVDTEERGTTTTRTSTGSSSSPISSSTRFSCQVVNGQYTVVYQPETQTGQYFPWATPSALGGGWSPQRRCNEISRRLEMYRPDGLVELTTGVENDYNTVCVTTERVPGCRIVFTVPPGQDPMTTRDRVFENLTIADSGQQTDAVNTYRNQGNDGLDDLVNMGREILGGKNTSGTKSKNINLKPFLDKKDGGTGSKLQGGVSLNRSSSNTRLSPGRFR